MIYTLTLNPAIDKILYLTVFEKNITNRIKGTAVTLGGKGTHVSMNLKLMGIENTAMGVCFGETGQDIIHMLEENGVHTQFLLYEGGNSRTNYLLIEDSGDCTLVADKGPSLDDSILQELMNRMLAEIQDGDIFIVSGDASNCSNPEAFKKLIQVLQRKKIQVFVDSSGNELATCLDAAPFLIKPNLKELSELTGTPMDGLKTDESIINAIALLDSYNIEVVAVSMGGAGSIVRWGKEIYRVVPPEVHVCNTIGCGDSFLSGLIAGYTTGKLTADTLRYATAVSSATAESTLSVGFDLKRALDLINQVDVRLIKTIS